MRSVVICIPCFLATLSSRRLRFREVRLEIGGEKPVEYMIRHEPGEFDDHPGPATDGVTGTGPRFGNRVHDDTGSLLGGRSAWHRRFGLCADGLHERCIAPTLPGGPPNHALPGRASDGRRVGE